MPITERSLKELSRILGNIRHELWEPAWIDETYLQMTSEKIGELTLNQIVGSGDPRSVGDNTLAVLHRHNLIASSSHVLEIGSGCGRAALPLTKLLGKEGRYVGLDIIPGLVNFCRRAITSRRPNFEFYAVKEDNPAYERHKLETSQDIYIEDSERFDSSFDVALSFSVFTHLQRPEAEAMLKSIWRRLKVGGMAALSFFILDKISRNRILRKDTAPLFLKVEDLDAAVVNDASDILNGAVAFDHSALLEMITAAGFDGIYAIQYGNWRLAAGLPYQDVVILKKEVTIPADFNDAGYLRLNPDVAAAKMNPQFHYRNWGITEGRRWRD